MRELNVRLEEDFKRIIESKKEMNDIEITGVLQVMSENLFLAYDVLNEGSQYTKRYLEINEPIEAYVDGDDMPYFIDRAFMSEGNGHNIYFEAYRDIDMEGSVYVLEL